MKYYLSENINTKREIRKLLNDDIISPLHTQEEHLERLEKIRNGLLIDMARRSLEKSTSSQDESQEYKYRTSLLIRYLHLNALGATGSISKEKCIDEINTNYLRLQYL